MKAAAHLAFGQRDAAEALAVSAALYATKADELPLIDECPILYATPYAYIGITQDWSVFSDVRLTSADSAGVIAADTTKADVGDASRSCSYLAP